MLEWGGGSQKPKDSKNYKSKDFNEAFPLQKYKPSNKEMVSTLTVTSREDFVSICPEGRGRVRTPPTLLHTVLVCKLFQMGALALALQTKPECITVARPPGTWGGEESSRWVLRQYIYIYIAGINVGLLVFWLFFSFLR